MSKAPNAGKYRDKATGLRETAKRTKDADARQDLLRLAAEYERLATSVERRQPRKDASD